MKHLIMRSIAIAALFANTASHAWDNSDNKVWLEGAVKWTLSDTLSLKLSEKIRYKQDGFEFYYRHTDTSITWKFIPNWTLTPAFRYASAKSDGDTSSTPIWHLNLHNKATVKGLDFNSRMRLMYSDLNHAHDRTDLRPKLSVLPSKGWKSWKLKPFIEDEIMINLNDGRLYRNRLSLGIKFSPLKRLSLSSFIMQEMTEKSSRDDWSESYNLGASARINL
ncbi:DUF2490 domain-containing protein [Pontiella sulfatireligans]|uniref:DUF2490 domain-containing protein n=1 Tax=Pontiella sulfatireligans TaxID=2750658 RepID=A0A6C2ULG8_9BACT|nr:DUF2490 domain-containing protein [Pontiella sulfatireligans]VGO21090.1 hypothetical protein SCARR_03159 [Pontiella sulfatireligans]